MTAQEYSAPKGSTTFVSSSSVDVWCACVLLRIGTSNAKPTAVTPAAMPPKTSQSLPSQ